MGKEDRVARFRCPACGEVFSASDYRRMQASDSERLAKVMEPGSGEES
jgi:transcription initiation factor IIE alpha subunit